MLGVLLVIAGLIGGAYFFLYYKDKKDKRKNVIVCYSELVGDTIIESDTQFTGKLDEHKDLLSIGGLSLTRPVPPKEVMMPTFNGKKKLYLIKIGQDRYAYRLPKQTNTVLTYKRDDNGNILKNKNNKPLLKKHKWQMVDDVIEPDVKHWEEAYQDELRKRHIERKNFIEKFMPFISMVMIFLFGVILFNTSSKTMTESTKQLTIDKQAIMERADLMIKTANEASKTSSEAVESLTRLSDKLSGKRIEDEEKKRQALLNATNR